MRDLVALFRYGEFGKLCAEKHATVRGFEAKPKRTCAAECQCWRCRGLEPRHLAFGVHLRQPLQGSDILRRNELGYVVAARQRGGLAKRRGCA